MSSKRGRLLAAGGAVFGALAAVLVPRRLHAGPGGSPSEPEKPKKEPASTRRGWRLRKRVGVTVGAVVAALVAIRLALPYAVRHYVVGTLDSLEGYQGSVDKVRIALYRGAYEVKGLKLWRKGQRERPVIDIPKLDLAVEWGALVHGRLVSRWVIDRPAIDYVKEPGQNNKPPNPDTGQQGDYHAKGQKAQEQGDWKERVQKLFPMDINRLQVKSGKVRYRDPEAKPPSDIRLDDIQIVATDLSNRKSKETLPAKVRMEAVPMGRGNLKFRLAADPFAKTPTFSLSTAMTAVPVTSLNPYLREYAKFDASGGTFDFFMEAAAADGQVQGYVKPLFRDLKILGTRDANPLKKAWKGVIAAGAKLLENKKEKQLGAKMPFSGPIKDPEKGLWPAVASVLQNGFIKALSPNLDKAFHGEILRAAPGPKARKRK